MKPKNYGKNISSVTTPVKFHLPDGSSQYFKNSTEALLWFNLNYGDGYSMVEYTPTQGDSEHPILLPEVTITAQAPKANNTSSRRGVDMFTGANYSPDFNKHFYGTSDFDALFGKSRVEGVRRALLKNPNSLDNWNLASNIVEGVNVMSGGLLNRLSPTQNLRLLYDTATGKNIINSWMGNNGIVSNNFAQERPYLSFGINTFGDLGISSIRLKPFDYGNQYNRLLGNWENKGSESFVRMSDNVVHKIPQKPLKYKFQIPFAVRSKLNANRYSSQVPYSYKGYFKNEKGYYPIYEQSKVDIPPNGSPLETKAYNDVISSIKKEPLLTRLQYNIFDIDPGHNVGILNGKGVMYDPILGAGIVPSFGSWLNRNFVPKLTISPTISGINGQLNNEESNNVY